MCLVGVSVNKRTGSRRQRRYNLLGDQDGSDRLIAAAEPLAESLYIGCDSFLFPGVQSTRSAAPTHDLVEDEQRAVAVADLADGRKVPGEGGYTAGRRAHHRLGAKGSDGRRAQPLKFQVELCRQACDKLLIGFSPTLIVKWEAGRNQTETVGKDGLVGGT